MRLRAFSRLPCAATVPPPLLLSHPSPLGQDREGSSVIGTMAGGAIFPEKPWSRQPSTPPTCGEGVESPRTMHPGVPGRTHPSAALPKAGEDRPGRRTPTENREDAFLRREPPRHSSDADSDAEGNTPSKPRRLFTTTPKISVGIHLLVARWT